MIKTLLKIIFYTELLLFSECLFLTPNLRGGGAVGEGSYLLYANLIRKLAKEMSRHFTEEDR